MKNLQVSEPDTDLDTARQLPSKAKTKIIFQINLERGKIMFEKIKIVMSSIFNFLLPFVKMFLTASGKIVLELAMQAVKEMATTGMPSGEKREEAFKLITVQLKDREIEVAAHVINSAIEAAYAKLKEK